MNNFKGTPLQLHLPNQNTPRIEGKQNKPLQFLSSDLQIKLTKENQIPPLKNHLATSTSTQFNKTKIFPNYTILASNFI
jgi:hypothetical protein